MITKNARQLTLGIAPALCEALESRQLLSAVHLRAGGSISGTVFNDLNADAVRQTGEAALAGRKVYLDIAGKGTVGERSTTASSTGAFTFGALPAGNYLVRAAVPTGWRSTTASIGKAVTLNTGAVVTGVTVGQTQSAVVTGTVFRDSNGDAVRQSTETGLAGWTVKLVSTATAATAYTVTTNAAGAYKFPAVLAAGYQLQIVQQTGFTATLPAGGAYTLSVAAGGNVVKNFGEKPSTVVTSGTFVFTAVRTAYSLNATQDLVKIYARISPTGSLAGAHKLLTVDATLSSAVGLVIRAYDADGDGLANDADFAGKSGLTTASFISLGTSAFSPIATSPSANVFHDLQTIGSFKVAGANFGGVLADTGTGALVASAVVARGAGVSLSGKLGAEFGPTAAFSFSA